MVEVSLQRPTLEDRRLVWEWMIAPGIVEHMMGPPTFPDSEASDYDEFVEDWRPHYFTHEAPERGRLFLIERRGEAVGVLAHNEVVTAPDGERATEIDMWLRGAEDTGQGSAPAAIARLLPKLRAELSVDVVFLQPSARNPRAIRAYEKAGFERVALGPAAAAAHYRTELDYRDSVFLAVRL